MTPSPAQPAHYSKSLPEQILRLASEGRRPELTLFSFLDLPRHWGQFRGPAHAFHILVAFSGEAHYFVDGLRHVVRPGSGVLLSLGVTVRGHSPPECATHAIALRFVIRKRGEKAGLVIPEWTAFPNVDLVQIEDVGRRITHGQGNHRLRNILLEEMLVLLCDGVTQSSLDPRIAQAVQLIRDRQGVDCSVQDMARVTHLSYRQFLRLFERETELTPTAYCTRHRVQCAQKMLCAPGARVQDVALALGYEDPFYFSRQFKRVIGCSPKIYQRQMLEMRDVALGKGKQNDGPQ